MNIENWNKFKQSLERDGLDTSRLNDEYMWLKPSLDSSYVSWVEEYAGDAPASMSIEDLSELARSYVTSPQMGTVEQWTSIFEYTAILQRLKQIDWKSDSDTPPEIEMLDNLVSRYVDRSNSDWFNLYRNVAMKTDYPFIVGLKQDGVEFMEVRKELSDDKSMTSMFFSFSKTRYFFCHRNSVNEKERMPLEVDGLLLLVNVLRAYSDLFKIEIDGSVVKLKRR